MLDTRIQIRPDFRDKLIEQLKGTFGKYYDYHRRDSAANEVDYLNVEDPDVFSHRDVYKRQIHTKAKML